MALITICSGIETEYPVLRTLETVPVLYVVTAEKPCGRCYYYESFNAANALTAQQGYEYRKGHVARVERTAV